MVQAPPHNTELRVGECRLGTNIRGLGFHLDHADPDIQRVAAESWMPPQEPPIGGFSTGEVIGEVVGEAPGRP